ncbi:hypothetical protein BDQ17DRAFT_1422743 [Cyathus striatus]|nr:hypothetical protein BDQ17DRAFT_1422743 [Cyathus striatus]
MPFFCGEADLQKVDDDQPTLGVKLGDKVEPLSPNITVSGSTLNDVGRDQHNNININLHLSSVDVDMEDSPEEVKPFAFRPYALSNLLSPKDLDSLRLFEGVEKVATFGMISDIMEMPAPDTTKYPPLIGQGIQMLMSKTLLAIEGQLKKSIVSIRYSFDFPDSA